MERDGREFAIRDLSWSKPFPGTSSSLFNGSGLEGPQLPGEVDTASLCECLRHLMQVDSIQLAERERHNEIVRSSAIVSVTVRRVSVFIITPTYLKASHRPDVKGIPALAEGQSRRKPVQKPHQKAGRT